MKKSLSCFLCTMLIITGLTLPTFASNPGTGNVDGGGGGMGTGTSSNKWTPGQDGVRVTVIRSADGASISTPIDYTNYSPPSNIITFFPKNKLQYRVDAALIPMFGDYNCTIPDIPIPYIINSQTYPTSIDKIKQYFCSEFAAKMIARDVGMTYDSLISGTYKLLLEPVVYITFNSARYGMTATEAALYDMQLGGGLSAKLPNVIHKNTPLAMYLEIADFGYPAWTGSTTNAVSNDQIISALGLGIVRYSDGIPDTTDLTLETTDYEYRTNTEVITAVTVSSDTRLTPDNSATVTFEILGNTYRTRNIYMPADGSQVVWYKWRTPAMPQTVTIRITCDGVDTVNETLKAKIVDLVENPPPNPTAYDRNNSYILPSCPSVPQQWSATWSVWDCYWQENWVECEHSDETGEWSHSVDEGYWSYSQQVYTASLLDAVNTMPDDKAVTASAKNMKSGYGVTVSVNTHVESDAPSSHFTQAQNALTYFPEFNYKTYWRVHEPVTAGGQTVLALKENPFSTYNRRVHFTPVWFPDARYTTYTRLIDAWTPAGMLSADLFDYVDITQSVFDDWHVKPK